jgi:hypothetical protein
MGIVALGVRCNMVHHALRVRVVHQRVQRRSAGLIAHIADKSLLPLTLAVPRMQVRIFLEPELSHLSPSLAFGLIEEVWWSIKNVGLHLLVVFSLLD